MINKHSIRITLYKDKIIVSKLMNKIKVNYTVLSFFSEYGEFIDNKKNLGKFFFWFPDFN
jgi:hypothetical protein